MSERKANKSSEKMFVFMLTNICSGVIITIYRTDIRTDVIFRKPGGIHMTAITRRRTMISYKAVIFAILFCIMLISFVLGSVIVKGQSKRHASASDTYFTNITVDDGDTLWSIAQANIDYDYYDSIYDYMEQLKDINNLTTDDIHAGDSMIVVYYADSVH